MAMDILNPRAIPDWKSARVARPVAPHASPTTRAGQRAPEPRALISDDPEIHQCELVYVHQTLVGELERGDHLQRQEAHGHKGMR